MTKRVRLFSYAADDTDTAGQKALPRLQDIETQMNKLNAIIPDWQAIEAKLLEHEQLVNNIKAQINDAISEQGAGKLAKLLGIISRGKGAEGIEKKPEQVVQSPATPPNQPAKEISDMQNELKSVVDESGGALPVSAEQPNGSPPITPGGPRRA